MTERELRRLLQTAVPPDEVGASRRAWAVVRAAYDKREPVRRERRPIRTLVAAAAALALVAAAFSPAGQAVGGWIEQALERVEGREDAQPALVSLPAPGRLLVTSERGPWVVQQDGSKRRLGAYSDASWSPRGLHVAVVRGRQLVAVRPDGVVKWTLSRSRRVRAPAWAPSGFRIAYGSGTSLRVVAGDGTGDRLLARTARTGAWAWRPGQRHVLAYTTSRGVIRVVDTDTRDVLWRYMGLEAVPRQVLWSSDATRLVALARTAVYVFSGRGELLDSFPVPLNATPRAMTAAFAPRGHSLAVIARTRGGSEVVLVDAEQGRRAARTLFSARGRFEDLAWSPTGRWLLVTWPSADQWLFLRMPSARPIRAVSNISREFDPGGGGRATFPRVRGWCC